MGLIASLKKLFAPKPAWAKMPKVDIAKRFDIGVKAGQGSMSKVYNARDRKLGRQVCLKVLDKAKTAAFEARFPGLKRPIEGQVCSALKHKNIVQTMDFGMTTNGEQFLVMELIDGYGLNYLIETRHKQLNGNIINYLIQMADGLEYMHSQKYLHRDICPRNIMVTKDGVVKLIDFGLAIPYTPDFCKPGNRTGTPDYLAPEVIKRSVTDHRVDLFALGVTAYEMLTNGKPWEGTRSKETIMQHLNSPGRNPRDLRPDLDLETAHVLIKAIERDPKQRYQSAKAFREALQELKAKY